ncbi:dihydropteroate synthase [Candidatus Omnitrophota bacterium]
MKEFEFSSRTYIMGILNITPDSFSGDGIYDDIDSAIKRGESIAQEGADIIDIGGESTRPSSRSVALEEEIKRVIPVIKRLKKLLKIPISIDTRKAEVALRALDNGALIVNDITGLASDERMLEVVSRYNAKVVIMHIKGDPFSMQQNPTYRSLIPEIIDKLRQLVEKAEEKGVKKENIIIDPGIGFGKTFEHNLEILNNLSRFKILGKPILVGPSRKSFIGNILGLEAGKRIFGTAASAAIAIKNGADIIRVHDVKEMKELSRVTDAILHSGVTVNA